MRRSRARAVVSTLATLIVVIFAVALRLRGDRVATLGGRLVGKFSPKFGALVEARLLDLQAGFQTLATFGEFAAALTLSLVMWALVALAYLICARAFLDSPSLVHFGVAATMLLLATSIGGLGVSATDCRVVYADCSAGRGAAWVLRRAAGDRDGVRGDHVPGDVSRGDSRRI